MTIKNVEVIENWLISKISELLELNPDQIDVKKPFTSYGVDSVTAVALSGDLEEWLGRRLTVTVVFDYPDIESLAGYLAESTHSKGLTI